MRAGIRVEFGKGKKNLEEVLDAVRRWDPTKDVLLTSPELENPVASFEWIVPDFQNLSWDEVLYLRTDRLYDRFRSWVSDNVESISHKQTRIVVAEEITDRLWQLAMEVQPNVRETTIKGFLGNIPLGIIPVNPIGIALAAKDVKSAADLEKRFGSIFWLAEARSLAKQSTKSVTKPALSEYRLTTQ